MFKVNNKDTQNDANGVVLGVFLVNFEHISRLVLVFLLLTLNWQMPVGIKNVEHAGHVKRKNTRVLGHSI